MGSEISIIGVGSIGKTLLDACIKTQIFDKINIIDGDKVKKHNYVFNNKFLNIQKVYACKELYGNKINPINQYLSYDNLTDIKKLTNKSQFIFDCRDVFDNINLPKTIKLYINDSRLFISSISKESFKFEFKSDYVSFTDLTKIEDLIFKFIKYFTNKNLSNHDIIIKNISNKNKAVVINTLGNIDILDSTKYIFSKQIKSKLNKIVETQKITDLNIIVEDGIYILCNEKYNLNLHPIHDILYNIEKECSHFPAAFVSYRMSSRHSNELIMTIHNQIGGA